MGYGISSVAVEVVRDLPLPRFFINAVKCDADAQHATREIPLANAAK